MTGKSLLVIDDDPQIGEFIRKAAQGSGFNVRVAVDSATFKKEYLLFQPDVVMLDIMIPEVDGIELLKFLETETSRSSIILISGADLKFLQLAQKLGAARGLHMIGVITKPIRLAELRDVLALAIAD